MLIDQAEALGEPPEDPLLLFSVLYGFWVANALAFNGDVVWELLFSVLYGFWVANALAFNGDVVWELAAQFLDSGRRMEWFTKVAYWPRRAKPRTRFT
jgi:23S rRNA maturation mini-RNase III